MIIVKLIGGLGNQMFQYTLGRKLAMSRNDRLKLDIEGLKNHAGGGTPRQYALSVFDIQENFANEKEIEKMKGRMNNGFLQFLQKLGSLKNANEIA